MTQPTNPEPKAEAAPPKRVLVLVFADPHEPDAGAEQIAAASAAAEAAGYEVGDVMFVWATRRPYRAGVDTVDLSVAARSVLACVYTQAGVAVGPTEVYTWVHQVPQEFDGAYFDGRVALPLLPWPLLRHWWDKGFRIERSPGGLSERAFARWLRTASSRYDQLATRFRAAPPPRRSTAGRTGDDSDEWGGVSEPDLLDEPSDAERFFHLYSRPAPARSGALTRTENLNRLSDPQWLANHGSESQPPLPLSGRPDVPLPRDGLYIRRNNAYATKAGPRVAELIEQGVLVDQTQIRFDDFLPVDDARIPVPEPGQGVMVSHGCVPAPAHVKSHPRTTHLLELAIKTAPAPPEGAATRPPLPVNFVFAVDTSGSMAGEKLDQVKQAIQALYNRLRDPDVLGIVTFDSQVRTLLPATRKRDLSLERLTSLVGGLRAQDMTDINLGIRYGIEEVRRHSDSEQYVNCLYVFSDGDPTSGEQNWIKIRANIAAQVRGDVTISCFGFGSDARMRELDALAGLTGGHCRFVTHAHDVQLDLAEDLTRRDHLAAVNVQVKVQIPPELTLWRFYGHDLITDPAVRAAVTRDAAAAGRRAFADYGAAPLPDLVTDEDGVRVFTADLAFGETYWLVYELEATAPASAVEGGDVDAGLATVQFLDTTTGTNHHIETRLTKPGTIPADAVVAHTMSLRTSEVVFYGIDDLYQNDLTTAKRRLNDHAEALAQAHHHHPFDQFRDDRVTLRKFLSLADNLGQPIGYGIDARSGAASMAIFTMNTFGHVRSGHITSSYLGMQ